jgi:anti-anti-sigma regulatory factor
MGSKFRSEVNSRDGVCTLKIAGVIDEDNELVPLEGQLGSGPMVLDLGEIERINSCGVRDWVNWLGRIEKVGARLVFVNCSPAIVSQINLVHNFTANGIVKSFYAPYFCPRCKKEKLLRLEARDLAKSAPIAKAPTCRCDECDGVMDFDEMEESYFAFLNNAKKIYGDPSFENTLREIAAAGDAGRQMKPRTTGGSIPPVSTAASGTPTSQPPSSLSPVHRTPTQKTPPGSSGAAGSSQPASQFQGSGVTTPPKASPGPGKLSGNGAAASSQPKLTPVRPDGPTTSPPTSGAAAMTPPPALAASNAALKPVSKPILPWVLLGVFLLAAAGLLAFALLR